MPFDFVMNGPVSKCTFMRIVILYILLITCVACNHTNSSTSPEDFANTLSIQHIDAENAIMRQNIERICKDSNCAYFSFYGKSCKNLIDTISTLYSKYQNIDGKVHFSVFMNEKRSCLQIFGNQSETHGLYSEHITHAYLADTIISGDAAILQLELLEQDILERYNPIKRVISSNCGLMIY